MKQIVYGNQARQKFLEAANELCNPVKLTLGPKGKNVIISPLGVMAYATKDGISVAGNIESKDPFVNAGIQIIRQASRKTVEDAGDGTSTACILAHALITGVNDKLIEGVEVADIKAALLADHKTCNQIIKETAHPLVTDGVLDIEKLKQIATISANNDEAIGQLFAEAYEVIGLTGTVLLEESKKSETYVDAVKGMKQDRGYVSPYFATHPEKCEFENPVFFVTDKNITQQKDIQKIVEFCFASKRPLVIFSAEINGEALGFLNLNKIKSDLQVCAVTIPAWMRANKDILKDIATYTGATFCSEDNGFNIDNITPAAIPTILGTAQKFTCSPKDSIIIGGYGQEEEITKRITEIDAKISPELADRDREELQARKSKLNGGVAILYAGGATEVERHETLARCEDSVLAVRSALEEGYVPGGGKVYLLCSQALKDGILSEALLSIITQICLNADVMPMIIIEPLKNSETNQGYNAKSGKIEDLCKSGVVDSAKVIRVALENAMSIALAFLNTDCLIVEVA